MVISHTTIVQMQNNCHQMSAKELDLVIMAQMNALRTHVDDKPSSFAGHSEFRPTTKYFVHGIPICQKNVLFFTHSWEVSPGESVNLGRKKWCYRTKSWQHEAFTP